MEIRVLNYFLTIVREGSINKAAQVLHITQPTLSRQIAQLEEELQVQLFDRSSRRLHLTEEGMLLRRRAEEILSLVDRTEQDLAGSEDLVEGTIVIGCGEMAAVEDLSALIREFHASYPKVNFDIITAGADTVKEQMEKGLIDIGVLLEPIEIDTFDFIRLKDRERWVALMTPEDPLAGKEYVTAKDLRDGELIIPRRSGVKNEVENWFGNYYKDLHVLFSSNLTTNGAYMMRQGLGRTIVIEGAAALLDPEKIVMKPLYPELRSSSVFAWKKFAAENHTLSQAVSKFINYIYACQA